MKKQSDLYIFKQLPPEMLEKVRNFAIKLLVEKAKEVSDKGAKDDKK